MKRNYRKITAISVAFCTLTAIHTNAQSWHSVGSVGISVGEGNYPGIAINSSGTPYVAYGDSMNGHKATVVKFNGSNWVTVGTPDFSAGYAIFTCIAIDGSGTPYVAYSDVANSQKATVMKYDGSNWVAVGTPAFTPAGVDGMALAINSSGTPYIAYQDFGDTQKATVMRYDGANWVTVGSQGFSDGVASCLSIAIDNSGTPYVAYQADNAHSYKATVMKYNGTDWVLVGSGGISAGQVGIWSSSLAIDGSGVPYVAYGDIDTFTSGDSARATVMKYNGTAWVNVGATRFSPSGGVFPSIAINSSGIPYVAYGDLANSGKVSVMKYNGSSWVNVGVPGFSAGSLTVGNAARGPVIIAIDGSGTPYVTFSDSSTGFKASVMKYGNTTSVPEQATCKMAMSVSPNPVANEVRLTYVNANTANTSLSMTSITGQVIMTRELGIARSGTLTLPMGELPAGIYVVQLTSGSEVVQQKLIKE